MMVNVFIDEHSPRLIADRAVLLLKSDVEGSEQHVINCCWDLVEQRRVHYMLLEISPCFKPGYDTLLASIMDCGYTAHRVPNKRDGHRKEYGEDPIGVTTSKAIGDPGNFVGHIRQENVLLCRA